MKTCDPCPSKQGALFGLDPEAYDLLNDAEYCNDADADNLYCPWKQWSCPMHRKMKNRCKKLHAAGKPIPYRVGDQYRGYANEPT